MGFTEPLNLEKIFVNYFAGGADIFLFIAMIFFAYLAVKFRMPNSVFLILAGLFIILMAGFGYGFLFTILLFLVGLFFYISFAKLIKS